MAELSLFNRRNLLKASGAMALASLVPNVQAHNQANQIPMPKTPQRKLGNLTVSALGLGCQGFGQDMYGVPEPSQADGARVIRQAYDHGVTLFDTAEAYGPFKSEQVVGKAIKPFRDQIVLATKFGWDIDQQTGKRTGKLNSRPAHIRQVVEAMLKRLQTDRIDLLYQHRVDPDVPIEDVAGTISDLIKEGKVLNWGLSEAGVATIRKAHAIQPLTAVQSEYSLFWRGREKDVIPLCEELGIGFVPWSPLAMGVLAGYVDENTDFSQSKAEDFRAIVPRFSRNAMKHNLALVHLVQKWAKRSLCTPAQFSLAWLLAQEPFITPIPGTTKSYHLLENIGANYVQLSQQDWIAFNQELNQFQVQGERLPEAVLQFSDK